MSYLYIIYFCFQRLRQKARCYLNAVDLKRTQNRQLQVLRLRAEQQAPDAYASELAEARWRIADLERKLQKKEDELREVKRASLEYRAQAALLQLERKSHVMVTAAQFL